MTTEPRETPSAPPPVRFYEIFSWAMFDFANSSYATLILTVAFSIYFTKMVVPAGASNADFLWGTLGVGLSNLLIMVTAPVLGAMADGMGRKKHFLAGTYLLCVAGTLALYFVLPGAVGLGLALFIVSSLGFGLGENLAAAFLPELSTPANVGRISGYGWALGYFGGLACLMATKPLLNAGFVPENLAGLRMTWVVTGLFFLVAALPTFLFLRERAPRGRSRPLAEWVRTGLGRLVVTARSARHFRDLARFLVVWGFSYAGLSTVVAFASIYAERNFGFSTGDLIQLFISLQLFSAVGAAAFGVLQDRIGARRTIQISLWLWIALGTAAALVQSRPAFWAVAVGAGLGIGSLQSASRGLVGLFSPDAKSAEFFGLWGFFGKLAFFVGPSTFGLVSWATGSQRVAIFSTVIYFVLALVTLARVDEKRGAEAAVSWQEPAVLS